MHRVAININNIYLLDDLKDTDSCNWAFSQEAFRPFLPLHEFFCVISRFSISSVFSRLHLSFQLSVSILANHHQRWNQTLWAAGSQFQNYFTSAALQTISKDKNTVEQWVVVASWLAQSHFKSPSILFFWKLAILISSVLVR